MEKEPTLRELFTAWQDAVREYNVVMRGFADLAPDTEPAVIGKHWELAEDKRRAIDAAHDAYNSAAVAHAREQERKK